MGQLRWWVRFGEQGWVNSRERQGPSRSMRRSKAPPSASMPKDRRPTCAWRVTPHLPRCCMTSFCAPHVLIDDFSRAISILRRLKSLGVKIAMDDFGTGYSSLSYLQKFPFDKIKIDRSFVSNVQSNPQSATIIRAVIGLGRGLNLPIVAEGVETQGELDFLTEEACDEIQGYLVGRPAPIDLYADLVGRGHMSKISAIAG